MSLLIGLGVLVSAYLSGTRSSRYRPTLLPNGNIDCDLFRPGDDP